VPQPTAANSSKSVKCRLDCFIAFLSSISAPPRRHAPPSQPQPIATGTVLTAGLLLEAGIYERRRARAPDVDGSAVYRASSDLPGRLRRVRGRSEPVVPRLHTRPVQSDRAAGRSNRPRLG